jgi:DNA-binding MarR family transcriptional regulator
MLDRLEQTGHVRREVSANDRRKQLVFTTASHRELREGFDRVSGMMTELFYRGFSEQEISRFEADLDRVLRNLNEAKRSGPGEAKPIGRDSA